MWKISKSTFRSRPEATCAVRLKELSHTTSAKKKRVLFAFSQVIFILSKAGSQTHCKSLSIGKDIPVGAFLTHKPFRNTPHFSWVAATHISSSFKKQNENTMVTQNMKINLPLSWLCIRCTDMCRAQEISNKGATREGNYCRQSVVLGHHEGLKQA